MLTEAGLLPGALMRNAGISFVCRTVELDVTNHRTPFTAGYREGRQIRLPLADHDGNYQADGATLERLEGEGLVALRYAEPVNGSANGIAGIVSPAGNVLGLMPLRTQIRILYSQIYGR